MVRTLKGGIRQHIGKDGKMWEHMNFSLGFDDSRPGQYNENEVADFVSLLDQGWIVDHEYPTTGHSVFMLKRLTENKTLQLRKKCVYCHRLLEELPYVRQNSRKVETKERAVLQCSVHGLEFHQYVTH